MSSFDIYIYYSPVVVGANRQKKEREEGKKGRREEGMKKVKEKERRRRKKNRGSAQHIIDMILHRKYSLKSKKASNSNKIVSQSIRSIHIK